MNEDLKRILDELEQDLLDDDLLEDIPQKLTDKTEEDDIDAFLAKILADSEDPTSFYSAAEPAFEDPDKPNISADPGVFCNFSNDYGNEEEQEDDPLWEQIKADRWLVALMGIASGLCIGIIGVLVYWLEVFLK